MSDHHGLDPVGGGEALTRGAVADRAATDPEVPFGRLRRLVTREARALDPGALTVLIGSALVLLVQLPGAPAPIRAAVAVAWFVAVPGLAWAWALPVDDGVERFAAVVALSLALDVLVAEGFVYLGLAGAFPAVLVLVALSVLGTVLGHRRRGAG